MYYESKNPGFNLDHLPAVETNDHAKFIANGVVVVIFFVRRSYTHTLMQFCLDAVMYM